MSCFVFRSFFAREGGRRGVSAGSVFLFRVEVESVRFRLG